MIAWILALQIAAVDRLAADDIDARARAEEEIRSLGAAAIPALEKASMSESTDLRERAKALLRDLDATSALVVALRSDEIPGNARVARQRLIARYDASVRNALLAAVAGDDLQQSIQAAYILIEKNDADAALKAAPDLVHRAAIAAFRGETDRFEWVAVHVLLKLGRDDDLKRALKGAPPSALHGTVRDIRKQAAALKVPFPAPLLRHYLLNLRSDDATDNANQARSFVGTFGKAAVPALRECLDDASAQARRYAAGILLDLGENDLPPAALASLIGYDDRGLPLLLALGADAQPALRGVLAATERAPALIAGRALLDLDGPSNRDAVADAAVRIARQDAPRRWRLAALHLLARAGVPRDVETLLDDEDPHVALAAAKTQLRLGIRGAAKAAVPLAARNLEADGNDFNARLATEVLVLAGGDAVPTLKGLLSSDDEQVVTTAVIALARLGKLERLGDGVLDRLYRAVAWGLEEDGAVFELIARAPAARSAVLARLRKSGLDGGRRADELEKAAKDWLQD